MLSFQKPGQSGLECSNKLKVIMEWSVLQPGTMSAREVMLTAL